MAYHRDRFAAPNSFQPHNIVGIGLIAVMAVLAASWLTWTFSPGIMSFDTLSQYSQVIGKTPLTDAHPPITVYLWRALLALTANPGSMLAFNQAFYWATVALLAVCATRKNGYRLLIFIVVGFCPPLAILSLHVWKDVGMFCGLGLASVSLLAYLRWRQLGWLFLSLLCIFFAVAVRINGFIPAIPLLLLCSYLGVKRGPPSWQRHVIVATLAASMIFTGGYLAVNKVLSRGVQHVYALGTLTVWDMVSVSLRENRDLVPHYLDHATQDNFLDALRKANSREANYPVYAVVSPYPEPKYQWELTKDWFKLVVEHPLDYLHHRMHVLKVMLGIGTERIYYPYHPEIDKNEFGLKFRNITDAQFVSYRNLFAKLSSTFLYRGWFYLVLAISAMSLAVARLVRRQGSNEQNILAATVAFSGIISDLSMLIIATAADYRYTAWTIFAALISLVILATSRFQPAEAPATP